jgi:transposase
MHRLLDENLTIAEIARRTGRSRQTIYNWIKKENVVSTPEPRSSKLDPYKAFIESRLERFDLPATVLLQEIRDKGYDGGVSILKDFISPIKDRHVTCLVDRFETEPGRQAQIDWSPCGNIFHQGRMRNLSLFAVVLGYSRVIWARFVVSERRPVLMDLLESFIRETGGIPKEFLVDNMKQIVALARAQDRPALIASGFQDFADHWRFDVSVCPPYWPRAKGKIERGISYIKSSFLEGRSFENLDDLNTQLRVWLAAVANVRIHGTTKERPMDRLAEDLAAMRPVGSIAAYPAAMRESRQVTSDARISYLGVRYSVDPSIIEYKSKVPVEVQVGTDERLRIYHEGRLVAEHALAPSGSPPQDDREHARIRRELRGKPSWKRPHGKTPKFAQGLPGDVMALAAHAPEVMHRSLDTYDGVM